ncbi:MAG: DUF1192 family protein [Alphaproteobacteria bacterium]
MEMEGDPPRAKALEGLSSTDDLSHLSEAELSARIDALEAEIERTRFMLERKQEARGAAGSLFKT